MLTAYRHELEATYEQTQECQHPLTETQLIYEYLAKRKQPAEFTPLQECMSTLPTETDTTADATVEDAPSPLSYALVFSRT